MGWGQASQGCVSCCTSQQCMGAYQGSQPGQCCKTSPPMCCPSYATCMANGCMQNQGAGNYGGGYGASNYGGGYGGNPNYGNGAKASPIQGLFRWVNSHM